MNRKFLRGKRLLAFVIAMVMMFGSSMTVFAARTIVLKDGGGLTVGQKLAGGDTITFQDSDELIVYGLNDDSTDYEIGRSSTYGTGVTLPALPGGQQYQVYEFYTPDGEHVNIYQVILIKIAGTGNNEKSKKEEKSSKPYESHIHSYSWVTVQEPGIGQDGIEEYRCSCGAVSDRSVIPATQAVVSDMMDDIKSVPAGGTVVFDSGRFYTMSDKIIALLAERSDAGAEITFEYEGVKYKMTIPAGADYTAILADDETYYGYFYFAQLIGATIEAK